MSQTSETEIRIPAKDTADFDADVLLRIEDDRIFFTVDDIRGRGGRGYLTPTQARQTAAALVRIAHTLDPTMSGTGPGAAHQPMTEEERERYGRQCWYAMPHGRTGLHWHGLSPDEREEWSYRAACLIESYRADHAADPGARRDRVARYDLLTYAYEDLAALVSSWVAASDLTGAGVIFLRVSDVTTIRTMLDRIAALAALDQPAGTEPAGEPFAVGDVVRLRDGVLPSLTVRAGPLREVAADRTEAIVDLGDGGHLWVGFREFVRAAGLTEGSLSPDDGDGGE